MTCRVYTLNVFFNILPTFLIFFSCDFRYAPPLAYSHRNCGTLELDIAMSKFPKMFDEDSISRIRGSCDCEGGGEEWMTKIAVKKIRLQSRPAFLWHLPTFSQTGWRSRLTSIDTIKPLGLSSTPGLLSCSTRQLGQATPPVWSDNLQCGCALTCYSFRTRRGFVSNKTRR